MRKILSIYLVQILFFSAALFSTLLTDFKCYLGFEQMQAINSQLVMYLMNFTLFSAWIFNEQAMIFL